MSSIYKKSSKCLQYEVDELIEDIHELVIN